MYSELACEDSYRVGQLKSTLTNRGVIIVIIKTDLQFVTTEIIKIHEGNDFAQAVVLILLTDREEK